MRALFSATTLAATTLTLLSSVAMAQPGGAMGSTPMAVDLKKAKIGSWAEYTMTAGPRSMKMRWALVGRNADGNTLEMTVDGGPAQAMGGKMTMKMVLIPDPTSSDQPFKQMVMQPPVGDPVELPLNNPQMPHQRFVKPDPKDLVGKEKVTVAGGSFDTSHYRKTTDQGTLDTWVSEKVPPLGVIKLQADAKAGGPPGQPPGKLVLELSAKGTDAKPTVTKPAKPFDPAAMGMGGGGPHGGPPPGAGAPHPGAGAPPSGAGAPHPGAP